MKVGCILYKVFNLLKKIKKFISSNKRKFNKFISSNKRKINKSLKKVLNIT